MEKTLALDLGTNSIGWLLRNNSLVGNQFQMYGVLTFKKGVGNDKGNEISYSALRTKKRSVRRLYQARKYRLWKTLEVLIEHGYCPLSIEKLDRWRKFDKNEASRNNNSGRVYPVDDYVFEQWIKLDFNLDGKPDYKSPYQLRRELAELKLDLQNKENKYKIGRALYHIAQRRGFKSSRKVLTKDVNESENSEDKNISLIISEKGKDEHIQKLYEQYPDAKTAGSLFSYLENNNTRIREENTKYILRQHYKDEIIYVFRLQGLMNTQLFQDLVESAENRNDGAIFFQRPLRSQKGLIGKCTFEPNKYRVPISHPSYELFRAWSFINNIRVKNSAEANWETISLENRRNIFNKFFLRKTKPTFHFHEIQEYLAKRINSTFFNFNRKTLVSGCPVFARLIDVFGDECYDLKLNKLQNQPGKKEYYSLHDIWHILFSCEDEEFVALFAKDNLGLDNHQTKVFLNTWNNLPQGYAMISLNVVNKVNPFLKQGFGYTEAVLLANIPTIIGHEKWQENEERIKGDIAPLINENKLYRRIVLIVNSLISHCKRLDYQEQAFFYDYKLQQDDFDKIKRECESHFGKAAWSSRALEDQNVIIKNVADCYQAFFKKNGYSRKDIRQERFLVVESTQRVFYKSDAGYFRVPKLKDTIADYLTSKFELSNNRVIKLYHPSEIQIYPPASTDNSEGVVLLGSPKTGAFKNPMAMRTMHELQQLVNYLIEKKAVDSDTRVVVEIARDLNDANKRWALDVWSKKRNEENQEFQIAIKELFGNSMVSDADIDKFRLWNEQNHIFSDSIPCIVDMRKDLKGIKWESASSSYYKAIKLLNKDVDKYRLWLEQNCICFYTGKVISLSDLFNGQIVDFEHTIPRSISFDNSLANKTICYSDYNRIIKKNSIPFNLPNYDDSYRIGNDVYSAILPRLKAWEDRIERIKQQVEFWKGVSKTAGDDIEKKNSAIRQKHLWLMELEYWHNKTDRFKIKEVTPAFKNSQLVDTQIVSKYAFHYLKSFFAKVDVQKGSVTAEFRKIYKLQSPDESKDRSRHSHHAKDAAVLSLIPVSSKRDELLKLFYENKEKGINFSIDPYKGFKREFFDQIDADVLVNNRTRNKIKTFSKRPIRKRGRNEYIEGTDRIKYAAGDCVRGQLHDETFYGAIKLPKREDGKMVRDNSNRIIQEKKIQYVLRVPLKYAKGKNDAGFSSIDEIKAVDSNILRLIEKRVAECGGFKEALDSGIFFLNKNGERVNRIRRIRVFKPTVKEPLVIKKQTYPSRFGYKENYYAVNAATPYYALYKGEMNGRTIRKFVTINLFVFHREYATRNDINIPQYLKIDGKDNQMIPLHALLSIGQKVLFYRDNNPSELFELDRNELVKRLYIITGFEKDGRVRFIHHLEARSDKALMESFPEKDKKNAKNGFSYFNFESPWPKLKLSIGNLNFLIDDKDFVVSMAGDIVFK